MSLEIIQRLKGLPQEEQLNLLAPQPLVNYPFLASAGLKLAYEGDAAINDTTLNSSYQRMIANAGQLAVISHTIERPAGKQEMHFVAPYDREGIQELWEEWADSPLMAHTRLGKATVAWWDLGQDVIWSKDKRIVNNVRAGIVSASPNRLRLVA
jgi:hypothetical protein